MEWKINDNSPIFLQLEEQLLTAVVSGYFPPGSRLPSVRELAAEAGVNPNTMQRAFAGLEGRGVILTNRTAGRSVTEDMEIIRAIRREKAREEARAFLKRMQGLGYSPEEVRQRLTETEAEEEEVWKKDLQS